MIKSEKELRKLLTEINHSEAERQRLTEMLPQLHNQKASLIRSGAFDDDDSIKELTAVDAKARMLPHKISQHEGRIESLQRELSPVCDVCRREAVDLIDLVIGKAFMKLKAKVAPLVVDPSEERMHGGTNLIAATNALWPFTDYAKVLGPLQSDVRISGSSPSETASHQIEWVERCEKARKQFPDLF